MTGNIDLHTHTIVSDGKLNVQQLVYQAKKKDLVAVGITDHDSIDGLEEGLAEGKKQNFEIVPGCELTCYKGEKEFHLLGYYFDFHDRPFQEKLKFLQRGREERARKMVDKLAQLGYETTFQEVRDLATGTIVLPHIAGAVINRSENYRKLVEDFGVLPDISSFIGRYLVRGAPAYVAKEGFRPVEAIGLIHRLGGLAVLAHPCWDLATVAKGKVTFDQDEHLQELVEGGLDGLEALMYRETDEMTKLCVEHFTRLAKNFQLVVTGGSDFHGFGGIGKELGLANVYLKVPYSCLEHLKAKKNG